MTTQRPDPTSEQASEPPSGSSPEGTGPLALVGDGLPVPCVDGHDRPYLNLDAAASTGALPAVAAAVGEFLPWYSSVHRGAGYKSQRSTAAYEAARAAALRFAGLSPDGDDVAVICRNTTEAINHLAYRLRLDPDDVVVTTVVEHHANLLPWARLCRRRFVECGPAGTFTVDDVAAALDAGPRPRLLTVTGASNVTGPLPAGADFLAWSGHKMYAPFGSGVLVGPRSAFTEGDPFLAGGGAVDLVSLDEVAWTDPPEREEAGSPNVIGAVALHAAVDEIGRLGWDAVIDHDAQLQRLLRAGLASVPEVTVLGPDPAEPTLPLVTFTVTGMHHALVAARLSAEYGIGVRHGCFCAHPYLARLLGLGADEMARHWSAVRHHDRRDMPGAIRASAGISTSAEDVERLVAAVAEVASGRPAPVAYHQDTHTGDFHTEEAAPAELATWQAGGRALGASCSRG